MDGQPTHAERKLAPADIDAIVDQLEARALERLRSNVGKGVLSLVTTWGVRAIIVLAAYGAGSSGFLKKIGF